MTENQTPSEDPIDQSLDNLEQMCSTSEPLHDTIEELKSKMYNYFDDLNHESVNLTNDLLVLQKLCLFYEDLNNEQMQPNSISINCSLMTTAFNDLSEPTNDYNHFVRFLSRHRKRIFSSRGSLQYIQRLQNKVQLLEKYFLSAINEE